MCNHTPVLAYEVTRSFRLLLQNVHLQNLPLFLKHSEQICFWHVQQLCPPWSEHTCNNNNSQMIPCFYFDIIYSARPYGVSRNWFPYAKESGMFLYITSYIFCPINSLLFLPRNQLFVLLKYCTN